jgi:uncharacterized metal-binding protein YceD (DUF177 family)
MITFKISDIPMGKSTQEMSFSAVDISLEVFPFTQGYLEVDFERLHASIKVDFLVEGSAQIICDRSLESFEFPISRSYSVVFRVVHDHDEEDEYTASRKLDLNKNMIDLSDIIRETIMLEIPIKKLHPRYFDEDGNPTQYEVQFGDESKAEEDSRWDALKKLNQPKTDS